MARQLWLLRHADAEPHGTRPDFDRRLTERGERQARLAGLALARMDVEIGSVLSSPKERALRTATLALQAWDEQRKGSPSHGELAVHPPLQQGFDARHALAAMAALQPDGRLLAIGHEPDFSAVVADLTGARIDLKKAGLAVVRLKAEASSSAGARPGDLPGAGTAERRSEAAGELVLLLRPAELVLIAGVAPAEV
jgi:phosphohistidine phosphatase